MQSAIKVATCKLGLQPGAAFQARIAQLAELVKAHKLVRFKLMLSVGTLMLIVIPGRATHQTSIPAGPTPYLFKDFFLTERVHLSYTLNCKMVPVSHT